MKSNPSLLAVLTLLVGATLGPIASPCRRDIGDDDLFPETRRNIGRVRRDIVHVSAPEQLGKRAKRRARGKRKGGA